MAAYEPVALWELRHTGPRRGVTALSGAVLGAFARYGVRNGGIYVRRRVRGGAGWSLHSVGRAVDFMVPSRAVGDMVAFALVRNANALGVTEVIWNRRRWTGGVWRNYSGQNPHTDHVHVGMSRAMADARAPADQLRNGMAAVLTGAGGAIRPSSRNPEPAPPEPEPDEDEDDMARIYQHPSGAQMRCSVDMFYDYGPGPDDAKLDAFVMGHAIEAIDDATWVKLRSSRLDANRLRKATEAAT